MEDEQLTLWLQRVPDNNRVQLRVSRSTATTRELVAKLLQNENPSGTDTDATPQQVSRGESLTTLSPTSGTEIATTTDAFHFIYRGQVIRPNRLLDDYQVKDGDTLFYYIGHSGSNSRATGSSSRGDPRNSLTNSAGAAHSIDDVSSEVLNSPFLDTIANNPELLMMIMEANPAIRQLKERSPELHALFSDPQTLRDAFQAMRNPSVMREMMRHSDRALSNIDAMPGGFDALRQVYKEVHEPVWESLSEANSAQSQAEAHRMTYDVHSPESEDPFPQAWPLQTPAPAAPEPPMRMVEHPVFPFAFFSPANSPFGMMPTSVPPAELYRNQIESLVAMGFTDRRKCEEALARHGGNLNQAIDDLLRQQSSPAPSQTNSNN